MATSPTIDVRLDARDLHNQLEHDARVGLRSDNKWIPATWFYDEAGCELFDAICDLPEYYPTRTERSILTAAADEIAALADAVTLVELGSGTSEKSALVIEALRRRGTLRTIVCFDVAEGVLRDATDRLARRSPELEVRGVVGDFRRHLPELLDLTAGTPRLVMFLGGTIGNLNREERHRFLRTLVEGMDPGDTLLVGTDLVKSPQRLIAAYDDSAGVTARFNRNVLHVLNRELGGDFDPGDFDHVARWNEADQRIEMRLRARRPLRVGLRGIGEVVEFTAGEDLLTEISCKFTPQRVAGELTASGFDMVRSWRDPADDFQVTLARPA